MNLQVNYFRFSGRGGRLNVNFSLVYDGISAAVPRVKVLFTCGEQTRRLPVLVESVERKEGKLFIEGAYTYLLDCIFYSFQANETTASFSLQLGETDLPIILTSENCTACSGVSLKGGNAVISRRLMRKRSHVRLKELNNREIVKYLLRKPFVFSFGLLCRFYCLLHPVVPTRITFMSGRRTTLGGNSEFVYNILQQNPNIEICMLFFEQKSGFSALRNLAAFVKLYSTSRVVIVDDFFRLLNLVKKRSGVSLVQLWHACGAFKTFGYTRLGKPGGPLQLSKSHRMYDYTFVSAAEVAPHYAEGFGISDKNIVSSGVPRCDVFFDADYQSKIRESFYHRYPALKRKKIILFAPTFRGNGQQSAYYPPDKLQVSALADALGEEYALIIKLHPFCRERLEIEKRLRERVLDLSCEDELNDLLFVTDILVTDYSSVVFEASLLEIPMLFYAFDLEEYIASRDFYYDYPSFVPGRIVSTQEELTACIQNGDLNKEKVKPFKNKFFDHTDGSASRSAAALIESLLGV